MASLLASTPRRSLLLAFRCAKTQMMGTTWPTARDIRKPYRQSDTWRWLVLEAAQNSIKERLALWSIHTTSVTPWYDGASEPFISALCGSRSALQTAIPHEQDKALQ